MSPSTDAQHFACTACGLCCYGQLPLTLKDALAHAERFPLAFVWTPVWPNSPDYPMTLELGVEIKISSQQKFAVLIVPCSYLPGSLPCPALGESKRCSIHSEKPSRCRAMPYYAYRDEKLQNHPLTLREDWLCDVSKTAPKVYESQRITDPTLKSDFDRERSEIQEALPQIRRYAEYIQKFSPHLLQNLAVSASQKQAQHLVTGLSSFLTATRNPNAKQLAALQVPLLQHYSRLTAQDARFEHFHKHYEIWAKEMAYLAR